MSTSTPVDPVTADATARLSAEFHGLASTHDILAAVHLSRTELSGNPVGAMPELVERLARVRVSEALELARRELTPA